MLASVAGIYVLPEDINILVIVHQFTFIHYNENKCMQAPQTTFAKHAHKCFFVFFPSI